MNDLISRQAAIDYLMTNMNWQDEDGRTVDDWDDKKKIIADLIGGIPSCWISVKDRLPEETPSFFCRFLGMDLWKDSMWKMDSKPVLVAVTFPDGTGTVTTGSTHDGVWCTRIPPTLDPVVTHWMPMPERPEEQT